MPDETIQIRSGNRLWQRQADDKASFLPCSTVSNDIGHFAGHGVPANCSFVRYVLMRVNRAVSAVLATLLLFLLYKQCAGPWVFDGFPAPSYLSRSLHEIDKALASSFLEVVEAYPPALTVASNGSLELTDGSSNATIRVIDNHQITDQEVLAVHSFGLSYGQPFVGKYAPPQCAFNRVTWNLTVVSAGRQFDRLGIIYLGDVEVFRTSTAEPTADGIRWTYLKASPPSSGRMVSPELTDRMCRT